MKTLFMETTEIPPEKTISEIESVLIQYGATSILKECSAGDIDALCFRVKVGVQEIPFRLPCRWDAIAKVFKKRKNISDFSWTNTSPYYQNQRQKIEDKARRVAWRQILRWVQAQLALVETDMVKVEEVFFPYIQTKSGKTVYELHAPSIGLLPERTGE